MNNKSNDKSKGTDMIIFFIAFFINGVIYQKLNLDNLPFIIKWAIAFVVVGISYKAMDFAYNFVIRKIKKNN